MLKEQQNNGDLNFVGLKDFVNLSKGTYLIASFIIHLVLQIAIIIIMIIMYCKKCN